MIDVASHRPRCCCYREAWCLLTWLLCACLHSWHCWSRSQHRLQRCPWVPAPWLWFPWFTHFAQMLFPRIVHTGQGAEFWMHTILTIVFPETTKPQLPSSSFDPKSATQIHILTYHPSSWWIPFWGPFLFFRRQPGPQCDIASDIWAVWEEEINILFLKHWKLYSWEFWVLHIQYLKFFHTLPCRPKNTGKEQLKSIE